MAEHRPSARRSPGRPADGSAGRTAVGASGRAERAATDPAATREARVTGSSPIPPEATGRDAPLPGKGAVTRRAILDSAIERFGREGFRATSVADIARHAGVGATVTYAYFPNKVALFLAALDEDAAAVMEEGLVPVFTEPDPRVWRQTLLVALIEAVERHPLARRVLSGLEPTATERMIDIPAMAELRKAVADRLRNDQLAGVVRADIDPEAIANGSITIIVSLMMSVLQVGRAGVEAYGTDVLAVFEAALDPPGREGPRRSSPRTAPSRRASSSLPAEPSRKANRGR
jgi:AcrR family transcriptional regulator